MNGLRALHVGQDRTDEARPLLGEVLETGRHVLGEDHPKTLGFKHKLGVPYRVQARYEDA